MIISDPRIRLYTALLNVYGTEARQAGIFIGQDEVTIIFSPVRKYNFDTVQDAIDHFVAERLLRTVDSLFEDFGQGF